ncbi:hypothetical protein KI387_005502 [Taxus chinensis]|uniref:Uncharacterized protein n=1 Tax=Taxus chinensis TaxID=29808 RepID=A0AA38LIE7_TAXCH|nr:hypothetical protein KI387_005502 [Taxus chinensis]
MVEIPLEEWQTLLITSIFIIVFLLDIWRARSNIAHWIPGKTVILGLTIHLVHLIGVFKSMQSTANKIKIYGARLSLYIFAGCLLPGMAMPGSISRYFNIATIFGSLGFHIAMEIKKNYYVWKEKSLRRFIVYHGVLTVSITFLFLFLTLVVLAGKAIRERLSISIPIILSQNDENENVPEDVWESFEVEVLKTRIIARACQPEYVLARSLCSTIAAFTAFICDVVFVFKVVYLKSVFGDDDDGDDEGFLTALIFWLQCVFITIGSAVIFYRWLMAVFYFSTSSWRRSRDFIFVETFASHTRVCALVYSHYPKIWYVSRQILAMYITISLCMPSPILRTMLWGTLAILSAFLFLVPYLVLFFTAMLIGFVLMVVVLLMIRLLLYISIFCWYLSSLLVFRSRILGRFLFRVDMDVWRSVSQDREFVRYRQALERVCMPGEVPASLWIADGSSIKKTRLCFHEAYQKGQNYTELIALTIRSVDAKHGPRNYVYMLEEIRSMVFKGYMLGMKEPIWKMTAYSIVRVIKQVWKAAGEEEDDFVSNAYNEARDLLDFVDNPEKAGQDPVYMLGGTYNGDEIAFLKAVSNAPFSEMIFPTQQNSPVQRLYEHCKNKVSAKGMNPLLPPQTIKLNAALNSIQRMFGEAEKVLRKEHILGESPQAKAGYSDRSIQPNYSLYMVCRLILDNNNYINVRDLLDELECFLGDVITSCMFELPDVVVKCCRKWAANFEEEKIVKAINIAGTARGVMQKSGLQLRRTWQLREPPAEWTVNLTALQPEGAEGSEHDSTECSETA